VKNNIRVISNFCTSYIFSIDDIIAFTVTSQNFAVPLLIA